MAAYQFHPIQSQTHMVAVSVTTAATRVHIDRSKQTSIYSLHLSPNGFPPKHRFQLRAPVDLPCDAGYTHGVTAVIVYGYCEYSMSIDGSCIYICIYSRTSQRNVIHRRKTRIKFNFFLPCFSSISVPTRQSSHLFEFVIDWHREKR